MKNIIEKINMQGVGAKELPCRGAKLAAIIREELKSRGVQGVTVKVSHWDNITVTVKATAEDFASIEEAKERFNFSDFCSEIDRGIYLNNHWVYYEEFSKMTDEEKEQNHEKYVKQLICRVDSFRGNLKRADYWELTTRFFERLQKIFQIANQWNYDNSDTMTDYFDYGYSLKIDIKKPEDFQPRESMTEEEKADYKAEQEEEERQREEALKKYKEEEERRQREWEERRKKEEAARENIENSILILDLKESEQLYITGLKGGIGKECNIDEVDKCILEFNREDQDAKITRKIAFTNERAFSDFSKMFLYDFDFIAGTGGTGTEDVRLSDDIEFYKLTKKQLESIKFYLTNCIAVYYKNEIQYVIDAQGYQYARYVYRLTDKSEILPAAAELKRQEEESKQKPPLSEYI